MAPLKHLNQSPAPKEPAEIPGQLYCTRKALAERYGLSVRALERWFQDGEGPPAVKIGRRVLYHIPLSDVWMAEHTVTSSSAATVRDAEGAR